jgi:hypothetical protein
VLKGVPGHIRVRGKFPAAPIAWKDADILYRDGSWWISVCVEMESRRTIDLDEARPTTVRFDLVDEFARVERAEGRRTARAEGARTQAQSPLSLHTLGTSLGNPQNAEGDERGSSPRRSVPESTLGNPQNAEGDERGPLLRTGGLPQPFGNPQNAEGDERVGQRDRDLGPPHLGNPQNAEGDEREANACLLRAREHVGNPQNAEGDERDRRQSVLPTSDLRAGNPQNAEGDERGGIDRCRRRARGLGNPQNAEGDERGHVRSEVPDEWIVRNSFLRASALCERADVIKAERDRRWPHQRGRRWSWRKRRETARAAKLTARATRIRREALHVWSSAIVRHSDDLTIVSPPVREQTASPRGDKRKWGACVETVSTLNRNTLNQAPALATAMLVYKAAESSIRCDVVKAADTAIAIGPALVAAGRVTRRARRLLKEQA